MESHITDKTNKVQWFLFTLSLPLLHSIKLFSKLDIFQVLLSYVDIYSILFNLIQNQKFLMKWMLWCIWYWHFQRVFRTLQNRVIICFDNVLSCGRFNKTKYFPFFYFFYTLMQCFQAKWQCLCHPNWCHISGCHSSCNHCRYLSICKVLYKNK